MFYSKDKATDFNNSIENTDEFKSFKYKAKSLGSTVPQPTIDQANAILKSAPIVVPSKLIYCKAELKLKSLCFICVWCC